MKRLLFTFFAIMLLGTSGAWGAGTTTTLGTGRYQIERTLLDIATEKGKTAAKSICNEFDLNSYVHWTSYGANCTFYNDGVNGCIYESQNSLAAQGGDSPSKIYASDGYWIESITIVYGSTNNGVISTQKTSVNPVPTNDQIKNNTLRPVNGTSISFYVGRNTQTSKANGRCDMTKITAIYCKLPTSITLSNETISVGNRFQLIPEATPADAYPSYTWTTDNADVVAINASTGVIEAKSAGDANITATSLNGKVASCKITVVSNNFKSFTDTFMSAGTTVKSYQGSTADVQYTGDNGVFHWIMRNFRRYSPDDEVDGVQWTRLGYNSTSGHVGKDYIAYDNAYPMEGGVKRISFQWKAASYKNPVSLDIDDMSKLDGSIYKTYILASTANQSVTTYTRDLNMDKNVQLRLSITASEGSVVTIGPLTITPYLLYTKKSVEVYKTEKNKGKYTNKDLINNTGATPSYSISCGTDIAEIDANGEVTIKKSGTATVTATWGNVSTTYTLIMHAKEAPVITFADQNVDMNQAPFTPEPTLPATGKVGTPSFSSTDKSVVKVNATTGELTIVGQGVATINVHYTEGEDWASTDVSYKVTVTDPMEDAVTETFTTAKVTSKAALDTIHGNVADWEYKFIRRDITQTTRPDTLRCGQRASRLQNIDPTKSPESYLITTKPLEGGIKRVSFLWNNGSPFLSRDHNFIVIAGSDKDTIIKTVTVPDKDIALATKDIIYNHNFGITENVTLSIRNNSGCYALIGNVKVTPYLLYTKKNAEAYKTENKGKYTNKDLINNTGATPSYSISCGTDTAEINHSTGEVTIKKSAVVTVTASWSNVSTTYQLTMHGKPAPTVTFADQEVDMYHAAYTPEPTEIPSSGMGDASYSSDDKNVVRVNATSGELTIVGAGVANINIHYAEGEEWASTDASYKVTVTEPVGENMVTEDFNDANFGAESTLKYVDGKLAKWEYQNARRRYTAGYDFDTLQNGSHATWLNYNEEAHFATTKEMEGGIKRVSFLWNRASKDDRIVEFVLSTGAELQSKDTFTKAINDPVMRNVPDFVYNHNVFAKENSKLSIKGTGKKADKECYLFFGDINVIPYLLYTKKTDAIDAVDYVGKQTYINKDTIDNTDGGEITYSILTENADDIATINTSTGELTIKGGGTITVQAAWNDNKVKTTYTLVINKAEYTPAFAKASIDTTMNAEALTNALQDVPATGVGAITYTSDNERVAKVSKTTGVVSAMGPGDATITVNIAEGSIYKAASTNFTIHVDEVSDPKEKNITESFPDYAGSPWTTGAVADPDTIIGEQGLWEASYARHNETKDKLTNERAVWLNTNGYISTLWEVGGIKRVKFVYNKKKISNRFSVIAGDIKDTIIAETMGDEYTYCHNFFLKKDAALKIHNICATAENNQDMLFGTVEITPYLYYTKKNDTITAADWQKSLYTPKGFINNTNDSKHITYISSNPTAAEVVNENGSIDVHEASTEPVIITAKWKTSETDSIVTSFSLLIQDKEKRKAAFALDSVSVERGDTAENTLTIQPVLGDDEPVEEYVSSNTMVAKIADDKKTVIAISPGTTIITAQIGETKKCLAGSVSYVLTVTYTPEEGTYWKETFSKCTSVGGTGAGVKADVEGDDGLKNWQLIKFQRRNPDDKVGDEQGIQVRYSGEITSKNALEGGIKEVVFNWRPFNSAYAPHFYVQAGDSIDTISHAKVLDVSKVIPYAHEFKQMSNSILKIGNFAQETPEQQGFVEVGVIKVIPYLLYTRKDTTVYAKDCENFEFINDSLIDNTNSEGTITYSVPDDNGVASIDGAGKITILGEGDVTITATWKPSSESEDVVTTTYQLHIVLENTTLTFAEKEVVKQLKSDPEQDWYQQQATLSPEAVGTFTYSIVDDPEGASINPSNGIVTYTAPGTYVIKATFAQQLPYKASEDTYTLTVNSLPTPTIEFNDVNKTMNDAPFTNPMKETLTGLGNAHYTTNNAAVATVVEGTGEVTIVGEGTATISVHFDEGAAYAEGDGSYTLTVTDPNDAAVIETYPGLPAAYAYEVKTLDGKVTSWDYLKVRHANSDVMADNSYAARYGNAPDAYVVTKDEFEGGIKRVSFKWNKASPDVRTVSFRVYAGEEAKDSLTQTVGVKGQTLLSTDVPYNHNFLVKKNAKLQICSKSDGTGNGCYLLVGAVKITPYLRFKGAKEVDADLDKVTEFNLNDTIINNTEGGTINFAVDSFKTNVTPTIEDGKVKFDGIAKGGKVYISATWAENPGVKTTLVINTTIKPEVNFAVPTPAAQDLISGSYTNVLSTPEGVGAVTYTSSNKQVATVDNDGKVTFLVAGTTTITAKVAASTIYNKTEKSYDLTIKGYTPAEGEAWVETFDSVKTTTGYISESTVNGKMAVYNWTLSQYAHRTGDKVGNTYQGIVIGDGNGIKTNNMEGGIKYVSVEWSPKNSWKIDFTVQVGTKTPFEYVQASGTSSTKYTYERFVYEKTNANLAFKLANYIEGQSANVVFGHITVVPYLLYTEKTASIKIGETYTNENLINNLEGDDKTAVQYAIVEGSEYATIEGNVVTGIKATPANKTVKVKAYLNANLYTTYTLTVTSSSEITLDEEANNSTIIASYAGVENMTVNLTRTLAAGKFNTFCVPFDVTMEQLETVLGEDNITRLATLDEDANATLDDSKKNLNIVIKDAESIEAGKPYLLWLENEVKDPTFSNVTISTDNEGISSKDNKVTFYGTTSRMTIGKDQKSILFVSNNNLKWNGTGKDSDMKGLRAYFDVPDLDESSGVAPRLVMRQPSAPTELMNVNANVNANKVLINDRIYIIRDGVYYDLNGQIVK